MNQEQNNSKKMCLIPGDRVLSRRILKRCREMGFNIEKEQEPIRIGRNRWGSKLTAYLVPVGVYEEEKQRREIELQSQYEREAATKESARQAALQKATESAIVSFPRCDPNKLAELVESGVALFTPGEVGYQFGLASKTYWKRLGYKVVGPPVGTLIRGNKEIPVYSSSYLIEKKSNVSVEELARQWTKNHGTEDLALAEAVRMANRLQKVIRRKDFYPLKDQWMEANQHRLRDGRISRHEKKSCWSCDGDGERYDGSECWKCGGTGIYSSRTLYEHEFLIDGRKFCFHSYIKPRNVSTEAGQDLLHYGKPFRPSELPLPPQSLIIGLVRNLLDKHHPQLAEKVTLACRRSRSPVEKHGNFIVIPL